MEVNGLHYKQFVYREVNWNTYEVIKELVYPDIESYMIQKRCFLKTKSNEKNIKEYNEFCYEVIKGEGKDKITILKTYHGILDYDYYERKRKCGVK